MRAQTLSFKSKIILTKLNLYDTSMQKIWRKAIMKSKYMELEAGKSLLANNLFENKERSSN